MFELVKMWALVETLGLLCLPLTMTVFHNLPDRGWAFSKSLGMAIFVFCVWLPLMCFHALPYSQSFLWGVALILLAISVLGYWRTHRSVMKVLRSNTAYVIITEVVFLGMVALLGTLRQFRPDIRSWETFMDEGIIAGIMRSPHLPPNDVWYSGYSINYYYYAHFAIATLGKLIGQVPSIVFNTGISTFFGLTAVNLFGLSSNVIAWARHTRAHVRTSKDEPMEPASHSYPSLLKAVPFGLFSMIMCVIFGNLASAQQWIEDLKYPGFYDWFSPSRVIPNTINEFPAFSFLLSDFHAHVLTLAFTILAMGIAFNLFLQHDGAGLNSFGHRWQIPFTLFVTALSMGQLFAMNGWDLPTYLGLVLVAIAIQQWLSYERKFQLAYLVDVASAWMSLIALSFLLFLPFYANYIVPMGGIGVVQPQDRSAFNLEILIFGLFLFVFVSLLVACAWRRPLFAREPTEGEQERAFPSFLLLGGILVVALIDILVLLLLRNSVTFVVMGDIALCGAVLMFYHKEDRALAFTLLVGALAFALVAGCEVFFMKDLFVNSYPRMNTVFKFYFQAWALLSVACGSGLYFILERFWRVDTIKVAILGRFKQGINVVWAGCLAVLVIASMIYPAVAPAARLSVYNPKTGKMQMTPTWSLDGLAYLKDCKPSDSYPSMDSDPSPFCQVNVTGDYYAIRWINANIKGDPIIIEAANAQDEDYSEYALVSSFTGLPTIMGWPGHEVQWRNGWLQNLANSASFDQRLTDINTIYTDPNPQVVLNLMHSYHAEYLYVGAMEYHQYLKSNPGANLHRFASFMQTVYNKDGVAIYKVK